MSMGFESLVNVAMNDMLSFMQDLEFLGRQEIEKKGEGEVGMVREYPELQEELRRTCSIQPDGILLFRNEVNKSTDISVITTPLQFDVLLGKEKIYSFNELVNAYHLYEIIQADIKGKVWHG